MVGLLSTSSKMIHNEFKSHKASSPTAQVRVKNKYPDLTFDWKNLFVSFQCLFGYKIKSVSIQAVKSHHINDIKLFAFKIIDSSLYFL